MKVCTFSRSPKLLSYPRTFSSPSGTPTDGKMIFALKKVSQDEKSDADISFEVLALQNKSNTRIQISHSRRHQEEREMGSGQEEEEEEGEKHIVPQHRQYLSFPTVGPGTPSQREKAFNTQRLNRVVAVSHQYQLEKLGFVDSTAGVNVLTKHKGMESIIEDKIQLSILQGDFDNLKGAGKPLVKVENPLVDRTTDLAFELLRKNGLRPAWIDLQISMTALRADIRARLRASWAEYCVEHNLDGGAKDTAFNIQHNYETDTFKFPDSENFKSKIAELFHLDEQICNKKVDAYNLSVPSYTLTRGRLDLDQEISKCCQEKFLSRIHAQEVIRESYAIAELHRHERISARNDFEGHGDMSSSCRVGERGRPTYNIDPSWSNKSSPSWGSSSKQRGSLSAEDHMFRLLMLPIDMLSNSLLKIIGKL